MDINKVGIVGMGTMGIAIAGLCIQHGLDVIANDIDTELLNRSMGKLRRSFENRVNRGEMTEERKEEALAHIRAVNHLEEIPGCHIVIEAIIERLDAKKLLFEKLDVICNPETILASNTSTLPVTQLAETTKRPEKVIGTHFLAPRPIGKLLELVKTEICSEETLQSVIAFSQKIERETIIVPDIPGFIVNRIYGSYILECLRLLEADYVPMESLDKAAVIGIGMPISPLRYLDINGLDTVLLAMQSIYEQTADPRFEPPELLKKMVADGQLGLITKKGFYDY